MSFYQDIIASLIILFMYLFWYTFLLGTLKLKLKSLKLNLKLRNFLMILRKINYLSSTLFFLVCNSRRWTIFLDPRSEDTMKYPPYVFSFGCLSISPKFFSDVFSNVLGKVRVSFNLKWRSLSFWKKKLLFRGFWRKKGPKILCFVWIFFWFFCMKLQQHKVLKLIYFFFFSPRKILFWGFQDKGSKLGPKWGLSCFIKNWHWEFIWFFCVKLQ